MFKGTSQIYREQRPHEQRPHEQRPQEQPRAVTVIEVIMIVLVLDALCLLFLGMALRAMYFFILTGWNFFGAV